MRARPVALAACAVIALVTLAATPGLGGDRAALDRMLASLPEADLAARHALLRHRGVSRAEAEALFADSLAAAYIEDTAQVLVLRSGDPDVPPVGLAVATPRAGAPGATTERLGTATLADFAAEVDRALTAAGGGMPRYLVKVPAHAHRPAAAAAVVPATPTGPAPQAVIMQEGFENNPFATWKRWDSTQGQYSWAGTSCEAHGGAASADAIRGGSLASSMTCTSTYANNLSTWMWDERCNSVQGAAQAWLDYYLRLSCDTTGDALWVLFFDSGTDYWGYGFTGNWSSWWHFVANMKQWYRIGDLTARQCVELDFAFDTNGSTTSGWGARVDDVTIRTDAPPAITCSISAAPAAGPAPLTVAFSMVASGASSGADYTWYFGDGATGTGPTPSHTYASPGTYWVENWVDDTSASCSSSVRIEVTEGCSVACDATAPTSAQAGAAVAFQGSVTPTGCGAATPTWAWNFGDGGSASEQSPSHTYTAAGTYPWTLTVTVAGVPCTRNGSVTVTAAPSNPRQLVPSVAQKAGAGGTQWRTGIAAVNRSTQEATLQMAFVSDAMSMERSVTLPPGGAYEWPNILSDLFQFSGEASGALRITSNVPVFVTSRTYNKTTTGTFGQYYPALTEAHALRAGQTGVLPQLKKNASYRTNVGAQNLGSATATVTIRLFGGSGQQVGTSRTITVDAGKWKQDDDIFTKSGAGNQEVAYATVEVSGANDLVWVYASVVDGTTGDPTTIPVVADATRGTVIWPLAEAGPGAANGAEPTCVVRTYPTPDGPSVPAGPDGAAAGAAPLAVAANPEDGWYSGTTNPQGRTMGLLVESGGIKQVSISYNCGGWTSDATYTYGSPCPVSAGTFTCGSTSCIPGGTLRITGTFDTSTSVYGLINIKDKPVNATCCEIANLGYTATRGGNPPPSVTAGANPSSGAAPLAVAFTATVTGGTAPLTYDWSFGDGGDSTQQNPTYTYTSQGTYYAFLTVTDAQDRRGSDVVQVTVTGGTAMQATASAFPTSGAAPLAVIFTGSATGGTTPYTWGWSFGDGATSSQQSPTHTYNAAGTYQAQLTVNDSAGHTATATATVTVTGSATLQATASASPTTGTAPLAVIFTGGASGGTTPYTWGWSFGDGATSTEQSPTHTYTAAGTFQAVLTVTDSAARTATATATVTVTGGTTYRYLIPSVAHNPGVGGTMWRTAVAGVNRSGAEASLAFRYTATDGATASRTVTLPSGGAQEWGNILETLFGLSSGANSSGTVEVVADRPVFLTSRTFNQTTNGTYGQYFPSLTAAAGMGPGRTGVLPHLKKNASFRTNIGVLNLGTASVTAEIRLFGATGTQVGSTKQLPVPAGRWVQQSDIFVNVGAGTQDVAYATVEVRGASDLVWAYASVIDASTGDPTTIPLLLGTP